MKKPGFIFFFSFILIACSTPVLTSTVVKHPTATQLNTATVKPSQAPSRTPRPTPTAQPIITPLPEVNWSVQAVELIDWNDHIIFGGWNENIMQGYEFQNDNVHQFSIETGVLVSTASATPHFSRPRIIESPSQTDQLVLVCNETSLQLRDGKNVIAQFEIIADCFSSVYWSPDSSAVSIVSSDRDVYVWETDGKDPKFIGGGVLWYAAYWSPDSQQLLVTDFVSGSAETATFRVLFRDGRPNRPLNAVITIGNGWEGFFGWLSNDIVTNYRQCGAGCGTTWAYDASTGDVLFTYVEDHSFYYQGAFFSQNGQWIVIDQPDYQDNHQYQVYDLENRQEFIWRETQGLDLDLVGWNSESSQFLYLEPTQLQSDNPFGTLFALDPRTRQSSLIIEGLFTAELSNQLDVVSAVIEDKESLGNYRNALYDLAGNLLTEFVPVYMASGFGTTFPVFKWANTSNIMILIDPDNQLWQLDAGGTVHQLSGPLTGDEPLESWDIEWSPDDKYVYIQANNRAWIVTPK